MKLYSGYGHEGRQGGGGARGAAKSPARRAERGGTPPRPHLRDRSRSCMGSLELIVATVPIADALTSRHALQEEGFGPRCSLRCEGLASPFCLTRGGIFRGQCRVFRHHSINRIQRGRFRAPSPRYEPSWKMPLAPGPGVRISRNSQHRHRHAAVEGRVWCGPSPVARVFGGGGAGWPAGHVSLPVPGRAGARNPGGPRPLIP